MFVSLLLILGLGYLYYIITHVEDQIQFEIEKLNLPVDSIQVNYEGKSLQLEGFDLKKVLFSQSALASPSVLDSKMKFGDISVKGVQWWKLYNTYELEADTIIIEGVEIHATDHIISQIKYNSTVPIQQVKAKVLIVKGDTISYHLNNHGTIHSGSFEVEKERVNIDLKSMELKSLFDKIDYSFEHWNFSSVKADESISCKKLWNKSEKIFLKELDIRTTYVDVIRNDVEIDGLDLEALLSSDNLVIQKVDVQNRDGLLLKTLEIGDTFQNMDFVNRIKIEHFQINGNKIRLGSEIKANLGILEVSDYRLSKSDLILNDLDNFWKRWKVKAEKIDFDSADRKIEFEVGNIRLQNGRADVGSGNIQLKRSKKYASSLDFDSIVFWEKDLVYNISKNDIAIDSILATITKADLHEDILNSTDKISIELPSSISVSQTEIIGANLKVRSKSKPSIFVETFNAEVSSLEFSANNKSEFGTFTLDMNGINTSSKDRTKSYKTDKISMNEERIFFSDIKVSSNNATPINSNTSVLLGIPKLDMKYNDIIGFLEEDVLKINELNIEQLEMLIDTDENRFTNNSYKNILSESLMKFSIPIDISTLNILKSTLRFKYRPLNDASYSEIYFNDLELTVSNICNIRSKLNAGSLLRINGKASFMGKAPVVIDTNFKLLDKNYAYQYKIELGTIEFAEINDLLTDLAGLKIKKGRLDKLLCNVDANKYHSKGTLDFYYRNLKVRYDKEKFIEKWNPVNFMITRFVLDQDNRQEWEHETGVIDIKREDNKSMYFQIWSAIFSGMKYVMLPVI